MTETFPAGELVKLLAEHNMTVCTGESLTGGLLAASIVDVPGASAVMNESYVTYSEEAKHRILGVSRRTIDEKGVISEECAGEMAEGLLKVSGCSLALSTTGLAGPGGAMPGRPVGTVFAGIAVKGKTLVRAYHFEGSRSDIRRQTVETVLREACLFLKGEIE